MRDRLIGTAISLALFAGALNLHAGSATWQQHPPDFYWSNSSDWEGNTIPNGPDDVATFRFSNKTIILVTGQIEVNRIVFGSDASSFTISGDTPHLLVFSGAGVINDSTTTQYFTARTSTVIAFTNTASAGQLTYLSSSGGAVQFSAESSAGSSTCTASGGGSTLFFDTSTAGTGTIINYSYGSTHFYDESTAGDGTFTNASGDGTRFEESGSMAFHGDSTAGTGTFINEAGTFGADGGLIEFYDNSTAGAGAFTNETGANSTQNPKISFFDNSNAGNGTFVVAGGTVGTFVEFAGNSGASTATFTLNEDEFGGRGGQLLFEEDSTGDSVRVIMAGNSILDISTHNAPGVTIGSIEGKGLVTLGSNNLTTGSNDLSTTFNGKISGAGSITKIGTGNLTLTNNSTYTGGTIISGGILLANNPAGSATGRGPVGANAGTVGGSGTIAGAVVVGTGAGPGAFLAPGPRGVTPGTLTIRKALTLKADSTYKVTFDSRVSTADAVQAKGIRIQGAAILFNDLGTDVLPAGTVFVIMSNSADGPISGQFSNLADGSTVAIGSNTYQANYEGGDGNDLTLTVQ